MVYKMNRKEEKCWIRELEMTELAFIRQQIEKGRRPASDEYRRYMEYRREELQNKYGASPDNSRKPA